MEDVSTWSISPCLTLVFHCGEEAHDKRLQEALKNRASKHRKGYPAASTINAEQCNNRGTPTQLGSVQRYLIWKGTYLLYR